MILFEGSAHRSLVAALALTTLAAAAPFTGTARAQSNAYGTDQRYCDQSALSQIFSTSTGNLVGSAAGAAAGGLVGSQIGKGSGNTVATIVGVLGGALGGGYVGRSMDQTDRGCVGQSLAHAPDNRPVAWQNPTSGSSYWVTPVRDLRGRNGELCRNYITDAVVNGARQRVQNTACQQADGNWAPVARNYVQPVRLPVPSGGDAPAAVSSDTILKVQQRLHDLGFYVRDNIDGQWGPATSAALRNFQRAKGLEPTGQLNTPTLAALDRR
jgi:surface antigen